MKIHKGFSTNKSSYRLISVSHTKKVCKNLNHLGGEGHNYACNIIQAGKHKNRKGMVQNIDSAMQIIITTVRMQPHFFVTKQ